MGNPLPVSLSSECRKAAKILNEFVDPVHGLDKVVPLSVLRKAKGFAIFSVFRIGMLMSARAGSGIVLAKLEDGQWSAPAAIGLGGLGGGFNAGAELTDFLIVLNSTSAVRSFMATGSLQLGGNMSVAAGPFGRTGEVAGSLSSSGGTAAMFSYSKSKGLYGGVSVEGTILVDRTDANSKAYGRSVTSKIILSGNVDVPEFSKPLVSTIERLTQSGGAVGAGLEGDFRNMGIGEDASDYGGYDDSSSREGDAESLDEYGYPIESKASRRVKGGRGDTEWEEEEDAPPMKRQWSDADRQAKRENQTRNVGDYVFGRAEARDENDPFADSSATAATAATASAKHRFSPSFSRSSSSRNVSSPAGGGGGLPTDYAGDNVGAVTTRPERPKHTRKSSSKGSFSFSALRGKGKTPPPFSDYDPLNPQGSLSKPTAYDNGGDDYSQMQAKKAAAKFPTQFANDFSSSEDEAAREASNGRYNASSAAAGTISTSTSSPARRAQAASASNNGLRADDTHSNGEYSWDEGEADARSREKYLDDFDRELQSTSPSASRRRSSAAVPGPSTTPRPFRNSPASSRPPLSNGGKNSFRPASAASSGGGSGGGGGRRSTTPTWARKLNFENGGRGSAGARAEEKNDPFFEAYDEARAEGLRRDLVGPAATQRKIKRYDPPPARGPVQLPTPSQNHSDAPAGSDQVVAAFDFGGAEPGDLPFRRGDVIDVVRRTASREDWWYGQCRGRTGDFPANYTEDV